MKWLAIGAIPAQSKIARTTAGAGGADGGRVSADRQRIRHQGRPSSPGTTATPFPPQDRRTKRLEQRARLTTRLETNTDTRYHIQRTIAQYGGRTSLAEVSRMAKIHVYGDYGPVHASGAVWRRQEALNNRQTRRATTNTNIRRFLFLYLRSHDSVLFPKCI